jgi:hypothetical protein
MADASPISSNDFVCPATATREVVNVFHDSVLQGDFQSDATACRLVQDGCDVLASGGAGRRRAPLPAFGPRVATDKRRRQDGGHFICRGRDWRRSVDVRRIEGKRCVDALWRAHAKGSRVGCASGKIAQVVAEAGRLRVHGGFK